MAVDAATQAAILRSDHRRRSCSPAASRRDVRDRQSDDEQPIGRMARAGVEDVDRAVAAARQAFDEGPWPRMTPLERSRILHKVATILRERIAGDRRAWRRTNCGKIIVESRGDVTASANCFEYYAGLATQLWGEQIPMNGPLLDYTLREPVGVCAQIVPWNFPLLMAAWKLGAGAGGRQHARPQAGQRHPDHRGHAGRDLSARRASRTAWSTSSPDPARRSARRWRATRGSTRSPSPARPRPGGASWSSRPARSRRSRSSSAARARTSSSPTPISTRRSTVRSSPSSPMPVSAARPAPGSSCTGYPRSFLSEFVRKARQDPRRRSARAGDADGSGHLAARRPTAS